MVDTREQTAGVIAAAFTVSRPAISQHLGVLRDAGLVTIRQDGRHRFYQARPDGLEPLRSWMESFWSTALDNLQRAAEAEQRSRGTTP